MMGMKWCELSLQLMKDLVEGLVRKTEVIFLTLM